MATMKMCKPAAQETGKCGATSQAMTAGQVRPCAESKKPHFWHRQHHGNNEQSHSHGHKLTQCFGAAYGVKPPHHGGGGAYHESEEIEVVRVKTKEERVKIVQHTSKSRAGKKCMTDHYKYSDSSDSESDNEGKGRRKKC
ncbi:hypothetical protein V2J09_008834 [Rumex salicifolius]